MEDLDFKYNPSADKYLYDPQKLGNKIIRTINLIGQLEAEDYIVVDTPGDYFELKTFLTSKTPKTKIIYSKNHFKRELGPAFGIIQSIHRILAEDVLILNLNYPVEGTGKGKIEENVSPGAIRIVDENDRERFLINLGRELQGALRTGTVPTWENVVRVSRDLAGKGANKGKAKC